MILPIYAYGQAVLKSKAEPITQDYPGLKELIKNMWDTMYNAKGVGLAAPQVGHSIRLFMVDTTQVETEDEDFKGIKRVFINAEKIEEEGDPWEYEEGCLSIPALQGDVSRKPRLRLRYQDENFKAKEETFDDMNARVIQHEYDHIEGILFVEHLKPLKRRRIKRKLEDIRKGIVNASYPLRFARK